MHHHHHFGHHHHYRGTGIAISGSTGAAINIAVMFFVGLLLLGIGVVFVVIAENVPILETSFLSTGGILAVVGLGMFVGGIFMWKKRANTQRVTATGVQGTAFVMNAAQTSMYVNGQPVVQLQLQVSTPTQAPYVVNKRETVPAMMMGRLSSGQPLPVRVDPAKPDNIVIMWESPM
jgi:hypothetical protein